MTLARTKLPLRKEFTGDRQIDRAQDNANEAQKAINAAPFLPARGRKLVGVVVPAGGSKTVVHGLGRVAGWMVTRVRTAPNGTYETAATTSSFTLANPLGSAVTLDLWVF